MTIRWGKVLLIISVLGMFSVPAYAGSITFTDAIEWDNEYNPIDDNWYVNYSSISYFDFKITEVGGFSGFSITPGSQGFPGIGGITPRFRFFEDAVAEGRIVDSSLLTALTGNFILAVSFGPTTTEEFIVDMHNHWGITSPEPFEDFQITATINGSGVSVPEPSSLLLLVLGIGGLSIKRRIAVKF